MVKATLIVAQLSLFIMSGVSFGHDLGIAEVYFHTLEPPQASRKTTASSYAFIVERPSRYDALYTAPILPNSCNFIDKERIDIPLFLDKIPNAGNGTSIKTFIFSCGQAFSSLDFIELTWPVNAILLTHNLDSNRGSKESTNYRSEPFFKKSDSITIPITDLRSTDQRPLALSYEYGTLGFHHILIGYDHLSFVALIVLLIGFNRKLLITISMFTVGHSITLAFATIGWVAVSSTPVEICIAMSIAFLAYELLRHQSGRHSITTRHPEWLAGAFGLLHGLGFAGALSEANIASNDIVYALIFFNIGVEIGQLLVIFCFYLLWVFKKIIHRHNLKSVNESNVNHISLINPKTLCIHALGGVGMFWAISRVITI